MFWTYILYSPAHDRYYIGQTNDIRSRLSYHLTGSTAYTLQTSDWQLVFLQQKATRADAMRLERKIKQKKSHIAIQRYLRDERNQVPIPVPIADW